MLGNDKNLDSEAPLFVLATRLYVHYKFKAGKTFNPQAAMIDDDYAREVLNDVRAIGDATLLEMAARFEAARFSEPMLDFPLESAS